MTHLTTGVQPCVTAGRLKERGRDKPRGNGYWVTERKERKIEGVKPLCKSASRDFGNTQKERMYVCCALTEWMCVLNPFKVIVNVCLCVCVCLWQTSAGEPQTGPDILARSKYTSRLSPYPDSPLAPPLVLPSPPAAAPIRCANNKSKLTINECCLFSVTISLHFVAFAFHTVATTTRFTSSLWANICLSKIKRATYSFAGVVTESCWVCKQHIVRIACVE